ncbi:MAG: universal stress protein [Flavobacteriaceae bacterium]|nr:universal stress protein [Flavobacteriaceae bacterium]
MDKIIVPLDFSKHSDYALEAAAQIAKKNNAQILALHMLEISEQYFTASANDEDARMIFYLKLAEKRFKEFLDKPYLKDVEVTPMIKHHKVFKEVTEVAEDHSVDLIVMGSHGTNFDTAFFAGSNTEKVIRHAHVPVLVIKEKPNNVDFKKVVFVTDFEEESIDAYKRTRKFLKLWGSDLKLVYVNVPSYGFKNSDEMEYQASRFLRKADGNDDNLKNVHYVSDYTVEEGVFNFANKIKADLIAIPTHGRTGFAHAFRGSITEDIANHSTIPVLSLRI